MTITASVRQTVPLRADLLAATAALVQTGERGPQLSPSSSIDNAALNRIYLLIPSRSIKQTARSARHHCDRTPPLSKSP